ncbi:MAG: hypothetical protein K0R27_1996 [Xanthobacteraceae bacterium]|jgi:hypothetical protein|nr:hypothetical protein [Xanthobacteraceae bacterium]
MMKKSILLGGMLLIAAAVAISVLFDQGADAAELQPAEPHAIEIDGVKGVAYYTVERDGYRVVATLADGEGQPVRFVGTLAPGQKLTISVPREEGGVPVATEIARAGDKVFVTSAILTQ